MIGFFSLPAYFWINLSSIIYMNTIKITALVMCFFAVLSLTSFIDWKLFTTKNHKMKSEGQGFTILELFTSEGCSSCPPADELVARIQKESAGKPVYVMAYHVDYWDRQGWKDVFSKPDFSRRQIQYSRWLNISSVYTPQVIINGKKEFIGSHESEIREAIEEQLSTKPVATLEISGQREGEKLTIDYKVEKGTGEYALLISVIQKTAETKVIRGENAGHVLSHVQIVRQLRTEQLNGLGKGTSTFILPENFDSKNWELLGMVQDSGTGEILCASKVDL
jgi:hypothetical protein